MRVRDWGGKLVPGYRTINALGGTPGRRGILYELEVTLEWPEIQFLARLGGWKERSDRKPGKIVITRGLAQLLIPLVTLAILRDHVAEHGALPPALWPSCAASEPPIYDWMAEFSTGDYPQVKRPHQSAHDKFRANALGGEAMCRVPGIDAVGNIAIFWRRSMRSRAGSWRATHATLYWQPSIR